MYGEQVKNGGMEEFDGNLPVGWTTTTPDLVRQVTAQGLVHTGDSAVALSGGANLSQEVRPIHEGCFYEFSFFAHAEGANVGVTATLTFLTGTREPAGEIVIRQRDVPTADRVFGYYRTITFAAPTGATYVLIKFECTAQGGQQLDIDDVSFSTL